MGASEKHEKFMARCIALAKKGLGFVSPNPLVGAVIVKNGRIIAEGYHHQLGAPHAEIDALKKIKFKAHGATLYCNLEPCFHFGRTPPCVPQVIEAGIKKVVIANRDPNPKVAGKSIRLLRRMGVEVVEGVLKNEGLELNKIFFHWIAHQKPYVILKIALTLDGKIAPSSLPSKKRRPVWITEKLARHRVHILRSRVDAVLVGKNTVIEDNPYLNVRGVASAVRQPLRVILDSQLQTPLSSHVFSSKKGGEVVLVCSPKALGALAFKKKGAHVLPVPLREKGRLDLETLLKELAHREVSSMLVEGGREVFEDFIKQGLADEILLHISPQIWGSGVSIFSRRWRSRLPLKNATFLGKDLELQFTT